jgi:hypothetical protein
MKRILLTLLAPPLAVCRFGCAGCCAAPIAVFWLAGMVSIGYGFVGGPANLMGPSWNTVGLGVILWVIASVWTALAIRGSDADSCSGRTSPVCAGILRDGAEEADPFEEVRKAR